MRALVVVAMVLGSFGTAFAEEDSRRWRPRPERTAKSGPRLSVAGGIATPSSAATRDLFDVSPNLTMRLGGEIKMRRFGFTPAVRVDYIPWRLDCSAVGTVGQCQDANPDGLWTWHWLHLGTDFRFALHLGRAIPFFSLGFGADLSLPSSAISFNGSSGGKSGSGFGMNIGLGADVLVTRRSAVGLHFTIHPGFTKADPFGEANPNVPYATFNVAVTTY